MSRVGQGAVVVLLGVAASVMCGSAAQADSATVYFSSRDVNCAIESDGTVGCDWPAPVAMSIGLVAGIPSAVPLPFSVRQVLIDVSWFPGHPGFSPGRFTLPGGNPPLADLGSSVQHAGASCRLGYAEAFICNSKGRSISVTHGYPIVGG